MNLRPSKLLFILFLLLIIFSVLSVSPKAHNSISIKHLLFSGFLLIIIITGFFLQRDQFFARVLANPRFLLPFYLFFIVKIIYT
ncbi:MAG TPA: hypothetical protein ENN73_04340, partial [Firmicutes bacterium]|nr:hypothetical protein [Bacillota bacterium]